MEKVTYEEAKKAKEVLISYLAQEIEYIPVGDLVGSDMQMGALYIALKQIERF